LCFIKTQPLFFLSNAFMHKNTIKIFQKAYAIQNQYTAIQPNNAYIKRKQ
jgi:hypothetical protein